MGHKEYHMKRRVLAAVGAAGALLCATVALAVGGGVLEALLKLSGILNGK